jgi:hypothetical protein
MHLDLIDPQQNLIGIIPAVDHEVPNSEIAENRRGYTGITYLSPDPILQRTNHLSLELFHPAIHPLPDLTNEYCSQRDDHQKQDYFEETPFKLYRM